MSTAWWQATGVEGLCMGRDRRRKKRSASWRYWLALVAATVACLVALAVLVDSVAYYGKLHAGISISGMDLGGKTRDEAMTVLDRAVKDSMDDPLTLTAGEKTWTVTPAQMGVTYDLTAIVDGAMAVTRDRNVFSDLGKRWKLYFSHEDLALAGRVDDERLKAFVAGVAGEVDVPPIDAALVVQDGAVTVVAASTGRVVDRAKLVAQLREQLVSLDSAPLVVPIMTKQPAVTAEDTAEARQMAATMTGADVTLSNGDEEWTLSPDEIAKGLGFVSESRNGVSTLVPFLDAERLGAFFDRIAPEVLVKPVDASFDHDSERVWVVSGKDGKQLDRDATAGALTAAALLSTGRSARVALKVKEPSRTTAEAKAMGVKERLTSYTTVYQCEKDRQINVKRATELATDVFLAPGQSYDFDEQVGPRTTARGFKLATGITGPGKLEDVLGGGICQVSTTMFNAVAGGKAGLNILERRNHSIFISHYPLGRDATVTDGGKNLRFVNDTKHYIWITGRSDGVRTTISVWGTSQGRKTEWKIGDYFGEIPMETTSSLDKTLKPGSSSLVQAGQPGKSLKTTRVVTENGKVIHKDVWTNVWPMYPRKIAVGPEATTTTTTERKPPSTTTTSEAEPTTTTAAS